MPMGVSLLTSLALALTRTPHLSQYLIRRHEHDAEDQEASEHESMERLMAAEEASLGKFFHRVVDFHQRWLRRALEKPLWLAGLSVLLIAASYFCYRFSGSDLMPEMDEGGFTLDYWTPAGASLAETNRMVLRMEQITNAIPEVGGPAQRTGLDRKSVVQGRRAR